ncbi:MAG: hypothetical protein FD146_1084 [Anaerolineaceae bacterium]|nr:MAG: hypothetical protein FD146_1084 [Anaerolineaceae bacterium]
MTYPKFFSGAKIILLSFGRAGGYVGFGVKFRRR